MTDRQNLHTLPLEVLTQILLDLPTSEILRSCRVSTRFNAICQSPEFWADKAFHDFNYPQDQFLHDFLGFPLRRYQWVRKLAQNPNESLIGAAIRGSSRDVNYLLSHGATNLNPALAVAAARGHSHIVGILLDHGATQVNEAVKQASRNNYGDVVEYLYYRGLDTGQSIDLNQALWEATRKGFVALVEDLIDLGATDFDRALVAAAGRPDTQLLQILLAAGASPDGINRALFQAASHGNLVTTRYLLEHGATDYGAAESIATQHRHETVVKLIQYYQAHRS
jgi:ankyrin repeat protein